jgi:DNA-binding response OmpR family regulator
MHESILLVESDLDLRRVMTLSLQQVGFDVFDASDMPHAYEILKEESPEILILELDFPHGNNGALINTYRKLHDQDLKDGAVILTTTRRPGDAWRKTYQPDAVVYKPFDVRGLCDLVRCHIQSNSVHPI